jgi:trimeric autotransporter adhesin
MLLGKTFSATILCSHLQRTLPRTVRFAGLFNMSFFKRKLRLLATLASLSLLALAAGCRGFFVNPTLQSISVTPSTGTVAPAGTLQMTATGTFDDGSTSNVTSNSSWQSSDTTVASVGTNSGLVKAAATIAAPPGVTTITATDGAFTNTATVTVCPVVTSIAVTASTTDPAAGAQITFVANAVFSGSLNQQDVTSVVTWNISNTAVIPSISAGAATVSSTASGLSTTVSASLCGGTSPPITIAVQ